MTFSLHSFSPNQASRRGKFVFQNVLFDVSYLRGDQLESPASVLSNYHLAPCFRTTNILLDQSAQRKSAGKCDM